MSPDELRAVEALLPETLAHAARAPFYAKHWGRRWRGIRRVAELSRLPLIDKMQASEHQRALLVGEPPTGVGIFSSGTTRGEAYHDPLEVPRTADELEARAASVPASSADPFPGWTLNVVAVHHGLPRRSEGPDELRVPWMHDANALAMIANTLRAPHRDGRPVTAMTIGSGPLKVLTAYLSERGLKVPRSVKLIGTSSFRLSTHWQGIIEERFGAQVFDNYSLSELGTPFTSCTACGALHMRSPPLIWELLALDSDKRARGGHGRLVFSTLFPFSQAMPLIRYDSGDVANEGPVCRATGQRGLRVLGRLKHGLVSAGRFVLNPVDVRDALEAQPETEKTPHPLATLGVVRSRELGPPRWTVRWEGRRAALDFEVRFDPSIYPTRARELERSVLEHVAARDAETRRWARAKRVTVRALLAGTLKPLTERYD